MNRSEVLTWLKRNRFKKIEWFSKSTIYANRFDRKYQIHKDEYNIWEIRISQHEKYWDRWANSTLTYMPLELFIQNFHLMPNFIDACCHVEDGDEIYTERNNLNV